MTTVNIDPNVRVRGNQTFAGFEDADASVRPYEWVDVVEPESGARGAAMVTEVDEDKRLIYLSVIWVGFR